MRNIERGALTPAEAAPYFAVMVEKVRDYAIFLLTSEGIIATWNDAAQRMKGYTEAEAVGQHLRLLYTVNQRTAGEPEKTLEMAARLGSYRAEDWRMRKDGSRFWALIELIAITDANGGLCGFCKITKDLTDRKTLETELQRERNRAQVTLRSVADGVIAVDEVGCVELMNARAEQLTGWSEAEAQGLPLDEVLRIKNGPLSEAVEVAGAAGSREEGPLAVDTHRTLISRDGSAYAIEQSIAPISADDDTMSGAIMVLRDVTASRDHLHRLAHQAAHDALTGLVNRAEFERRLRRVVSSAENGAGTGALLFMDLDGFKAINDTSGHESGDRLLQHIARVYLTHIRARDTLARIGGDEFAMILENCSQEAALAVAQKLLDATRQLEFGYGGARLTVGVSIGMTVIDARANSIEQVLHAADLACYRAKYNGKGRIEIELAT